MIDFIILAFAAIFISSFFGRSSGPGKKNGIIPRRRFKGIKGGLF